MYKFLIILLFTCSVKIKAADTLTFTMVDSISNLYYSNNEWNKLIIFGEEAIKQDIDYKKLRQKIGYAYYINESYYNAQTHYQKAYFFDRYDENSILYLYYCAVNIGNQSAAQYYAGKLSKSTRQSLNIALTEIISSLDVEYNYKLNDSDIRSNPNYYRVGVNSLIGNRINIYQSVSTYNQIVNSNVLTKQNEYFVSTKLTLYPNSTLTMSYHFLATKINTDIFWGNMFFSKFSSSIQRFNWGLSASYLDNLMGKYKQIDANIGYILPGKLHFSTYSTLSSMINNNEKKYVFAQKIGLFAFKPLWVETNIILGNIKNYNDNNGLYIYNSLDATVFRTAATFYLKISKNWRLIGNYTYDKKEITNLHTNYNQHSFSGGLIWKL